jgi:hypothetical protein
LSFKLRCSLFGARDIPALRSLVSAAQENHQGIADPAKIDPVAWTEVNAQLTQSVTYRPDIALISQFQPINTIKNRRPGHWIAQLVEPLGIRIGFANFQQLSCILYRPA